MTLAEAMVRAANLFASMTAQKAHDGDFSLWEIDQALGELNVLRDALECAKAQFEAACEDAGGKDYYGDQRQRVRFGGGGTYDRRGDPQKCNT
jgi:hypothetical protein